MAGVRWSANEYDLLVSFYERYGAHPSWPTILGLRNSLLRLASEERPGPIDEHFRSPDSLRTRLYLLRLVAEEDPRGLRDAPRAMREAWQRRGETREPRPFVEFERFEGEVESRTAARRELGIFLSELETLLGEFVQRAPSLMSATNADNFRAAWAELGQGRNFELARETLLLPAVEEEIVEVGLAGAQLRAKWEGFRNALKRLSEGWTWASLRPSLRWANILLGSLGSGPSFGMIDAIRELKELGEASAEEADEESSR